MEKRLVNRSWLKTTKICGYVNGTLYCVSGSKGVQTAGGASLNLRVFDRRRRRNRRHFERIERQRRRDRKGRTIGDGDQLGQDYERLGQHDERESSDQTLTYIYAFTPFLIQNEKVTYSPISKAPPQHFRTDEKVTYRRILRMHQLWFSKMVSYKLWYWFMLIIGGLSCLSPIKMNSFTFQSL